MLIVLMMNLGMFSPTPPIPPNPPTPTPSQEGGGGFGGLKHKEDGDRLKKILDQDNEDIIIILSGWMISKNNE